MYNIEIASDILSYTMLKMCSSYLTYIYDLQKLHANLLYTLVCYIRFELFSFLRQFRTKL